jgi:hypothetical protein
MLLSTSGFPSFFVVFLVKWFSAGRTPSIASSAEQHQAILSLSLFFPVFIFILCALQYKASAQAWISFAPTYPARIASPPPGYSLAQAAPRYATMQSMQRQFGKLMNKAPGDNAKVTVVLNDYDDADNVLAKVRLLVEASAVHFF